MNGSEVIPEITHPFGKYWHQPKASSIEIDETYALMDKQTFDELPEYSCSQPTGAYEGKMWKRENGAFDQEFISAGGKPEWWLCWYDISQKSDCVSTRHRIIKIKGVENV